MSTVLFYSEVHTYLKSCMQQVSQEKGIKQPLLEKYAQLSITPLDIIVGALHPLVDLPLDPELVGLRVSEPRERDLVEAEDGVAVQRHQRREDGE